METPKFGKREPRPYDYQEMTWGKFIRLREWAKTAVNEIGYPIYLVGSTLKKEVPRDFDVVIVVPLAEYEERFGKLTEDTVWGVVHNAFSFHVRYYFDCVETLGEAGHTPLDFKVYPDTWFVEEDKLLLAKPKEEEDV